MPSSPGQKQRFRSKKNTVYLNTLMYVVLNMFSTFDKMAFVLEIYGQPSYVQLRRTDEIFFSLKQDTFQHFTGEVYTLGLGNWTGILTF